MAQFNFYLKDPNSKTATPIYLQITSNGKKTRWYFKQSLNPLFWNKEKQECKGVRNSPEINLILSKYKETAQGAANQYTIANGNEPDPNLLKLELDKIYNSAKRGTTTKKIADLLEFETYYFEMLKNRTSKQTKLRTSQNTISTYEQTFRVLRAFSKQTEYNLKFENIDLEFHKVFVQYLTEIRNFKQNTINKHVTRVKTFMNESLDIGLHDSRKHQSKHFTAPKQKVKKIYLTESELLELENLDLSEMPSLERVRDMFILGCYTGLRFSDFNNISKGQFHHTPDGDILTIGTQKTNKQISLPILPPAQRVINKYTEDGILRLPRPISNAKFNQYIKQVAKRADSLKTSQKVEHEIRGLKVLQNVSKWELVTTHTARRSFATNMYKRDIPVQNIMALTGHSTESSFYTYIQMTPKEHAVQMFKMFNDSKAAN